MVSLYSITIYELVALYRPTIYDSHILDTQQLLYKYTHIVGAKKDMKKLLVFLFFFMFFFFSSFLFCSHSIRANRRSGTRSLGVISFSIPSYYGVPDRQSLPIEFLSRSLPPLSLSSFFLQGRYVPSKEYLFVTLIVRVKWILIILIF